MKLIQQTNRYFLGSLFVVLIFSGILIFLGTNYLLNDEAEEKILLEETRLMLLLKNGSVIASIEPHYLIEETTKETHQPVIEKIELFDPIENENEPYLELRSVRSINGENFEITIRKSALENEELILLFLGSFLLIMLFSFSILYFLNKYFSNKLWIPFYQTLQKVESFSVDKGGTLNFDTSTTDEFNELNSSLEEMSAKMVRDYNALKEFSENASHEIQTPLTIIQHNLEEVLQAELDQETMSKVYSSYQAAGRLSKLNEKLLLLIKLDNRQFVADEVVDLSSLCEHLAMEFKPLFDSREIQVQTQLKGHFNISLDQELAVILISNLFSNALKYCDAGGKMTIFCNDNELILSNSFSGNMDTSKLFDRFYKSGSSADSMGLGLSISKKIAELSHLDIQIEIENEEFKVCLRKK